MTDMPRMPRFPTRVTVVDILGTIEFAEIARERILYRCLILPRPLD